MRCFACNITVENGHDKKTDRDYCQECMEPTNRVLLRQLDEEMNQLFGLGDVAVFELDELDQEYTESYGDDFRSAGVYPSPDDEQDQDEFRD